MKRTKIIIAILTVILLLSSLSVISFAVNDILSIAEDYSYIEYDGEKYVRVNHMADDVRFSYDGYLGFSPAYTEKQKTEILDVELYGTKYYVIRLSVDFVNGGYFSAHYVRESCLDEYNAVASLTSRTYSLYKGVNMLVYGYQLSDEICVMPASLLMTYENYYLDSTTGEPSFCYKEAGIVIVAPDGECYYLDYAENGSSHDIFSFLDHDNLKLHKITDPLLCHYLTWDPEAEGNSKTFIYVSSVMVGLFFGILPLALGILCFMKRKSAKEPYRRLYTILMSACAVAVVLLIILAATVLPYL